MGDVSAQVVLSPRTGRAPDPAQLTAARVAEVSPDPDAAERVAGWFRDHGFRVGPVVGISFSLTGPPDLFEAELNAGRALAAAAHGSHEPAELALDRGVLPAPLARHVAAVTFTPPPDFGPVDFGPVDFGPVGFGPADAGANGPDTVV